MSDAAGRPDRMGERDAVRALDVCRGRADTVPVHRAGPVGARPSPPSGAP